MYDLSFINVFNTQFNSTLAKVETDSEQPDIRYWTFVASTGDTVRVETETLINMLDMADGRCAPYEATDRNAYYRSLARFMERNAAFA